MTGIKLRCITAVRHNGKIHDIGAIVELPEIDATALVAAGGGAVVADPESASQKVGGSAADASPTADSPAVPPAPEGAGQDAPADPAGPSDAPPEPEAPQPATVETAPHPPAAGGDDPPPADKPRARGRRKS